MANKNIYRIVLSNNFLGVSKELSAPNRYELDRKVENQKKVWEEKIQRELIKQNKEKMKSKAEMLTKSDEKKINEYNNIAKVQYIQTYNFARWTGTFRIIKQVWI